jgi:hypothetical protein
MGLGPCRVGLCSNISSFIPIIYKNLSFLPHLILETKIAHRSGFDIKLPQRETFFDCKHEEDQERSVFSRWCKSVAVVYSWNLRKSLYAQTGLFRS